MSAESEDPAPSKGKKVGKFLQSWNKGAMTAGAAHAATDSSNLIQWVAQSLFSSVNVGSHVSALNRKGCVQVDPGAPCLDYEWTSADKWTTTATSVSLGLAVIMLLLHYCCLKWLLNKAVKQLPELIVSLLVLGFVSAGLPAIMSLENDQALNSEGEIINANLYFFSWASLAVAVYVFCNCLFKRCFKDRNMTAGGPSSKWYFLLAATVVVTSSGSRLLEANCSGVDSKYCKRLKYGIAAGAAGTFFALVASLLTFVGRLGLSMEVGFSCLIVLMYGFAVAFVTFGGDNAPASTVGNLYFSTWISFILAVYLTSHSFDKLHDKRHANKEESSEEVPAAADDNKQEDAPPPETSADEAMPTEV